MLNRSAVLIKLFKHSSNRGSCVLLSNSYSSCASLSNREISRNFSGLANQTALQQRIGLSFDEPWKSTISSRKMSTAAKEKYLSMTIEEKRSGYKCGQKYTILDEVQSWDDYSVEAGLSPKKDSTFTPNQSLNTKISIWRGDITTLEIDAIVNAANNTLLGGGGVDGAIHSAAGRDLVEECKTLNGCETGEAKITGGYKLPAKYVIHTVGPRGEKPDKLQQCYNSSLNLLLDNKLRTVAFPCISTGIYGYPSLNAAHIALKTVRDFLEKNSQNIDRVIFCIFLKEDWDIYHKLVQEYFPVVPR